MNKIDLNELKIGKDELANLSTNEYGMELEKLQSEKDAELYFKRLSRLIGITMKQPFTSPINLPAPSPETGALRRWPLINESFSDIAKKETWQYHTLEELRKNGDLIEELGW